MLGDTKNRPAATIASLAVNGGPMDLSGEYLDWIDERLASSLT